MADNSVNDIDVISDVLKGNADAFEILLKRYDNYVFKILSRHIPYDMIEELAQEVFIRAYTSLPSFKGSGSFKSWLATISVRSCRDFWRQRYKDQEIPMSLLSDDHNQWLEKAVSAQSNDAYELLASKKEALDIINFALNKLSADDRMILTLLYLEELSVKETAEMLNLSYVNVKVKSYRLKAKLRRIITELLTKQNSSTRSEI
ncbi:ECF subfamily RNA polymerase sigma-24 factor [Candidatus Magnetoovum chiemensis]|nr:ECF subfamily RNA polymerase sigma-24 factor [Candidatus Magnetoovum chiemensis]